MAVVGVIFAKGGGTGLPDKMLQVICGKPMVQWVVKAVKDTPGLDEIYLSTEDPEIMAIGAHFGLTEFWRPPSLCRDDTPPQYYWNHFLLTREPGDLVLIAQGASPLVSTEDYSTALWMAGRDGVECAVPVCDTVPREWQFGLHDDNELLHWGAAEAAAVRRQETRKWYRRCGSGWCGERDYLLANPLGHGPQTYGYVVPKERACDVDDFVDLELARVLMGLRNAPKSAEASR